MENEEKVCQEHQNKTGELFGTDQVVLFQPRPHYQRTTLIIWRRTRAMMNKKSRSGTGAFTYLMNSELQLLWKLWVRRFGKDVNTKTKFILLI